MTLPRRWLLLMGLLMMGGCTGESGPTAPSGFLSLGQSYGGGIIFYLDETGFHGLVAATQDQGRDLPWFNGAHVVTGAIGSGIGTGRENTTAIVLAQGPGVYAAGVCDGLVLNGYDDWFLPSKDELHALYLQRSRVGGFRDGFYWTSTEQGEGSAWEQVFTTGVQYNANKNFPIGVRAIRAF